MRVLIAVKGCKAHLERWQAQMQTWAVPTSLLPPFTLLGYFTGELLKVPDDYGHLPEKTKAICGMVKDHDFCFLTDTDSYVSIPKLLASGYEAHDYIGYRLEGKDYASGGAGYWLSRKAMQVVASCDPSRFTAEDEMVGTVLKEAGIKLHHDPRYALYRDVLPTNDVISRHLSSRGPYQIEFMYAAHRLANP